MSSTVFWSGVGWDGKHLKRFWLNCALHLKLDTSAVRLVMCEVSNRTSVARWRRIGRTRLMTAPRLRPER
ncbi:hypothetical protein OE88DRAFT_1661126 [Heliocybe sulcata]|uniref:Uncharacterized protein n=1 Tax=Heliocybe sulcata TaxID=5364 RepID=A0A5C3MZI3_9AGAM|nr:hypothetical protein OE88DRAFT_1665612 [Heliocybe sulcata]TFK50610.1 hypothetical protein OE88DRAFT_1661126 [Heliocybe sulcata]